MASCIDWLIRDTRSDLRYNNQGLLINANIDRSIVVIDLTSSDPQTEAIAYVQSSVVPQATGHPNISAALATGYRAQPLLSHDKVEVIVNYAYNPTFTPTTYTVEVSAGLQTVLTNAYYDISNNLVPMFVGYYINWEDPETNNTPSGSIVSKPATCPAQRPITNIVITKTINATKAALLEAAADNYVAFVNSTTFRGRAANQVMCTGVDVISQPYNGEFFAKLTFSVRIEGWEEYSRVTSTRFGTPPNIWIAKTTGSTYPANGIAKFRVNPNTDLNTLVAIL